MSIKLAIPTTILEIRYQIMQYPVENELWVYIQGLGRHLRSYASIITHRYENIPYFT